MFKFTKTGVQDSLKNDIEAESDLSLTKFFIPLDQSLIVIKLGSSILSEAL